MPEFIGVTKLAMRDQLLTARKRLPLVVLGERARLVADHLMAVSEVRGSASVAAYVGVGSEPGTGPLLDALRASGKRVLLPLLQPDNDLDWAVYRSPDDLRPAGRGLLEPNGPALGREAIATADVVLVPGLAVGRDGVRLGRGGGSYDRALGRVPVGTFVCVVLHHDELLEQVPSEVHDRAVSAAVTEEGVVRF